MNFDIKEYILRSREGGISDNVIKTTLLNLGHDRAEVEAIYKEVVGAKANESENYFTPTNDIQFGNQPATPSPSEIAQQAEQVQAGKQKNKKILTIIISVVLLFAGAGGGFAYYNYTQNLPANILKKFNLAWPTIVSFRNKLKIAALITPTAESSKQLQIDAEMSGSFDLSASTDPKISAEITARSEDFSNLSPVGLNFVLVGKSLYLRSWDFNKIPFMDLSSINGIWIKAEADSVDEYASGISLGSSGIVSEVKRAEGFGQRFKEAMQNPPVNFIKELPAESINGVATYHYLFNIDSSKTEEFIGKLGNLTEEEIAQRKTDIEGRYPSTGSSTLELWIYKDSYMPAKILVTIENQSSGNFKDSVVIENSFSDINALLTIPEPNNYKNLKDVIPTINPQVVSSTETQLNSSTTTEIFSTSTIATSTKTTR